MSTTSRKMNTIICENGACGAVFQRSTSHINRNRKRGMRNFCSQRCRAAADHGNTVRYLQQGTASRGTFNAEHRAVYERENGSIPEGFEVHHINGNMHDNRPENLIALTVRDHRRIHRGWVKDGSGNWTKPCRKCGARKSLDNFYWSKNGHVSGFCKPCELERGLVARRRGFSVIGSDVDAEAVAGSVGRLREEGCGA